MMDMFSLFSSGDGKKDKQVKKRRTEVLAVGIAEDDDGANAEDEGGEAEETCSERAQQVVVKNKKEKKKKKDKQVKKRRTEVLAVGIVEDDDGANAEDEHGEAEETCSEQARQEAMKKKNEKKKKKKGKRHNKEMNNEDENEEHSDLFGETHEDNQAQAEDGQIDCQIGRTGQIRIVAWPDQRTPMPLTDCSNAAVFMRETQVVLEEARGSNDGVFLDLCCGKGGVGKRAEAAHGQRAIRADWASEDPAIIKCDLADPAIRKYIKTEIIDKSLTKKCISVAGMLHVPCETFSPARHGKPGGRTPVPLRDYGENVWGLPGLTPRDQAKLEEGNNIARALLNIRDDLKNAGAPVGLENGDGSMLFKVPEMDAEDATMLKVCYCMMGRCFRKRTRLLVWNAPSPSILREEVYRCATKFLCSSPKGVCRRTGEAHLVLRGWVRGKALTKQGEKYPKKFVNMIARILCSPAEPAA